MDAPTAIGLGIAATAALSSLLASLRNGRKIQDVHLTMNSRLDALLAATRAQAFAEGVAHERAGEADRVATELLAIADAKAKVLDQDKARDG
jgi:hypothetical protein